MLINDALQNTGMQPNLGANLIAAAQPQPINAPIIHTSMTQVAVAANDFIVTLGRARNFLQNGTISGESVFEVIAQVYFSPSSAKDLHQLLGQALEQYEKDIGVIMTPQTKFTQKVSVDDRSS